MNIRITSVWHLWINNHKAHTETTDIESAIINQQSIINLIACFYLRTEVAFLHFYAPACLDGLGYLLHRGEEYQHAYCCQHAAVYLTDGRSDEPADDEQEAGDEGDVECTHGVMYNL